ncbi:MAG: helix-turn-helix transcriptional regulator [Erysipelotrichaceae bacterium]|nr:helix-turn-helix transcriptional regulator [Erysipelotrichaceae bacterium]MBQ3963455.1 helix-turn-helix transcriptional regulator [Erysipelotrichaceae bacterium]
MCLTIRIDMIKTGRNIARLRKINDLTIKDIQGAMGFNTPQAIYKWIRGEAVPSVDNLVVLSELFDTAIDEILVRTK